MAFSWSSTLANRFHIDLAKEMWKRFPGMCPYCKNAPCKCKTHRAKDRKNLNGEKRRKQPISLTEWQRMFAKIYPNNITNSAMHLAEEAGEVDEAIRNYLATHSADWFDKIVEELVDVITNIWSVANCLKFNLVDGLVDYFMHGCPQCHEAPCRCGYVITDNPIPILKSPCISK